MNENRDWPSVSDPRLLAVLQAQVVGALQDLHQCTDDGLNHLAQVIELHPDSELVPHVLSALTDLQRIDRAMQRLHNVASSLDEWKRATCVHAHDAPTWTDALTGRYVMPEEREAMNKVLTDA